jgi:formamidopyrimidine-DNA glycosylase
MPELLEVELYRRAAEAALGRPIAAVHAPDSWYLKRGLTPSVAADALVGRRLTAARRTGKQLYLDSSDDGPVLGVHFGMAGRLVVDGAAAIERLEYASNAERTAWDRFGVRFADGGALLVRDSRRLGAVELDPDEARLGPDAWTLGPAGLRDVLAGSQAPVKARLMDQSRIAGIGNLLADEALWRAGVDPARPAGSLTPDEVRRLHRHLRRTLDVLWERGGSHTGDLHQSRARGAVCPRDGAPLLRRTVGGRTTYSCPEHQR